VSDRKKHSEFVKKTARELGFQYCGISRAEKLQKEQEQLELWLHQGMHGQMSYMANNFDKRLDPTQLVPGAKSVVSLLYNYYPEQDLAANDSYKIAKYAYGEDYHFVIKDKLKNFLKLLQAEIGEIDGRVFVDSAPVMERQWAERAGLGWLGKNSLLLNRNMGSFFFIAELIVDLEMEYDDPIGSYCGTCTRCIDACPTGAIPEAGVVDGSRCISYLTIELKEAIPNSFSGQMDGWIFGCDICQDVCPWNKFAQPANEPAFVPHKQLGQMKEEDWEELTTEVFGDLFKKSAVKRTKFSGLKRNIQFAKESRD
jgi:epoxyqueuosine reductase